jgi:hypothetical protein
MLGKLLKYEFKALLRIMPALYLALLALGAAAGVNSLITRDGADWSMRSGILQIALGLMCFALFIVTLVMVILRFRDNFLKDEGYLMFTLPVTEWELVASKAIAGLCVFLLTTAAAFLALLIYGFIADYREMLDQLSRSFRDWDETFNIGPVPLGIKAVSTLIFVFQQLCLIYASMTVSQMAPRFRGIVGFGLYLGVMIVVERLSEEFLPRGFFMESGLPYLLGTLLVVSAFAALCFWCTGWLLKRTFNLE